MSETERLAVLLDHSDDPEPLSPEELRDLLRSLSRIAVVGLSRDPRKAARRVPSYLAAKGLDVIPVNPNADRIFGRPAHDRLADVDGPVDLVLVFRPSSEAGGVIRQAMERPEKPAIWLQEGILAPEEAREAREAGHTVVQDLCIFKTVRELEDYEPRAPKRADARPDGPSP